MPGVRPRPAGGPVSDLWKDPVYGTVAGALYRRCGLVFEGGQGHLFRKRLERRADELGYPDVAAYSTALASRGDEELDLLVDLLTVNETYFFREEEHFNALLSESWSGWARGGAPVRVWSAGCSTGCEAYTLAILLRERGVVGPGRPPVEILATDVNNRVLDEARAGLYGEFSLRNTPDYYRAKYFRKERHLFRLDPEVRAMVTFRKVNLMRPDACLPAGSFHAVLCRNVLIYFDIDAKRQTVRALTHLLRPGGVLVVGRSESLFNIPEAPPLVNFGGVLVYRKT